MSAPAVAVVTAVYGGFDTIRPQTAQDTPTEWVCVTDDPELVVPEPWRKVILSPHHYEHPCMAAKRPKMVPWTVVPHEQVLWIDANMEITSPSFAREALACIHDGIALHRHPRRTCIYDEAEASLGTESQGGKYDALPIREQVAHYREEGHPEHGGLYACGTIAWDTTNPGARRLGAEWHSECELWGWQDQLSFPVVARQLGVEPGMFPWPQIERKQDHFGNRHLRLHPHL